MSTVYKKHEGQDNWNPCSPRWNISTILINTVQNKVGCWTVLLTDWHGQYYLNIPDFLFYTYQNKCWLERFLGR